MKKFFRRLFRRPDPWTVPLISQKALQGVFREQARRERRQRLVSALMHCDLPGVLRCARERLGN